MPSPNMPAPAERPAAGAADNLQMAGEAAPAPKPGEVVAPGAAAAPSPPPAQATSTPQPKMSAADVAAAIAATPAVGSPLPVGTSPVSAADVDVIEPEWVDKAEEVVRAHQGDPYAEEEAIEELQQDYLKKRYGLSVGDASAGDAGPTKPAGS